MIFHLPLPLPSGARYGARWLHQLIPQAPCHVTGTHVQRPEHPGIPGPHSPYVAYKIRASRLLLSISAPRASRLHSTSGSSNYSLPVEKKSKKRAVRAPQRTACTAHLISSCGQCKDCLIASACTFVLYAHEDVLDNSGLQVQSRASLPRDPLDSQLGLLFFKVLFLSSEQ
jgi:hypothetical protein